MGETGTTPGDPETEPKNWGEMAKAKIDEANRRYPNLLRSLEMGGEPMILESSRSLEEEYKRRGIKFPDKIKKDEPRSTELARAMQDAMNNVGITPEEADKFLQLRRRLDPSAEDQRIERQCTEDQYQEIISYLDKVDQIYQALLAKGFTVEEIRQ